MKPDAAFAAPIPIGPAAFQEGNHARQPHALLSLIVGILILVRPVWLNYIVAIYLIVIGILGLR